MTPSSFTPGGLLLLSAEQPIAERLHATILRLLSSGAPGDLSVEVGSFVDCLAFAMARVVARAQHRQEQLSGERLAASSYELLSTIESEYGLAPLPTDTVAQRQRALFAAAFSAALGCLRPTLEQALADALGDAFLGLHVMDPASETTLWPASLGDQPMLLASSATPRKLVRLTRAISAGLGSPQFVSYERVDPVVGEDVVFGQTLLKGDRLLVEPENTGRAEVVTVLNVTRSSEDDDADFILQATFNSAHEPNCWATAMPYPAWASSQMWLLVRLTAEGAVDPEVRRLANNLLRKRLTGVSTWSLCPDNGSGGIGPLTCDDPVLGRLDINPTATFTTP